jgi:hypothetical protein
MKTNKKICDFALVLLLLTLVSQFAHSETKKNTATKSQPMPEPTKIDDRMFYPAKVLVQVDAYVPERGLYHISRPEYPNVKSIFTTPKDLATAITSIDLKALLKKPTSVVGNEYSTDKDLLIIDDNNPFKKNPTSKQPESK